MFWIFALGVALGAYLLGSIPSGYIVGRSRGIDLRKEGSCNIGATNALRILGKKWGYLVFFADAFKGWLACTLAFYITLTLHPGHEVTAGIIAAACVILGHNFPVWLGFKGGKGIATSAGIMIGLYPIWVFLAGITLWSLFFFTTRYVSIASIVAAISLPLSSGVLMLFGLCDWRLVVIAAILAVIAIWRHKSNIQRLMTGTEKKFEKKHSAGPPA